MRKIHLEEVKSTNSWMLDGLSKGESFEDETVVYTLKQTAGRGQVGNVWESEPGKNIAFSMLLCPEFLPIRQQFVISELCSLGVVEALDKIVAENGVSATDKKESRLSIKWPNDIYAGDLKLGGILIENRLMGSKLSNCVLGVGLNVNQEQWIGNAPNPVSLRLLGIKTNPAEVLDRVVASISQLYQQLKENPEVGAELLHQRFMNRLYRGVGFYPYFDPEKNESFEAEIVGVEPHGPLILRLQSGEERRYWFKEVRFVLPCGVTKE